MDERLALLATVKAELKVRDRSTRAWSFAYYGSLYSAVIFSSASALILKIEFLPMSESLRSDWAAILAGLAALIGLISGRGNFRSKWRINRLARGRLKRLAIRLDDEGANVDRARSELADAVGDVEAQIADLTDEQQDPDPAEPR